MLQCYSDNAMLHFALLHSALAQRNKVIALIVITSSLFSRYLILKL
jgi:hypothetical protein